MTIETTVLTKNLFRNSFKYDWSLKPHIELREKGENHKQSTKPPKSIQDIPVHLLKKIISHTYAITDTKRLSSLRRVCRSWNLTINRIMYDEISRLFTKYSPEITLQMKCQPNFGKIKNLDLPLKKDNLTNRCRVEFFPQIKEPLFADYYKFLDFLLFIVYYDDDEKKTLRKEKEIPRFVMKSGKFDNTCVNSDNVMIDLDLAFQYIPHEPMTFRTKAISFSPIYVLDWFNNKSG